MCPAPSRSRLEMRWDLADSFARSSPLLPRRRVLKHLHENPADYRARLKSNLLTVRRRVPIAQGHTSGSLVRETVAGIGERFETGPVAGQGRRPDQPVELGVRGPIVERKPKRISLRFVKR